MHRIISRVTYELLWAFSLLAILLVFGIDWLTFSKNDSFVYLLAGVWTLRATYDIGMLMLKKQELRAAAEKLKPVTLDKELNRYGQCVTISALKN